MEHGTPGADDIVGGDPVTLVELVGDNAKAVAELGLDHRPLRAGLRETVEHALARRAVCGSTRNATLFDTFANCSQGNGRQRGGSSLVPGTPRPW